MFENSCVSILGATGAVGAELVRLLEIRTQLPASGLKLLASPRSAGRAMAFRGEDVTVEAVTPDSFAGNDVAFMSAGASRSREFAPHALRAGAIVIDNSSAFRMDPGVPLIVPEINMDLAGPENRLFPVANCSALILVMALNPLRSLGKMNRIIVSTYQSASGGGAAMMEELETQTGAALRGEPLVPQVLPFPYAFNVFSHNTAINADGDNDEEAKVMLETRKILGDPDLKINVTCVRVPVLRAHSESVTVEFEGLAPTEEAVRQAMINAPGVTLIDDRANNHFPMPLEASGQGDVLVGRIRRDRSHPSAISMFICGDQLLKGAALNAIQIAEALSLRMASRV